GIEMTLAERVLAGDVMAAARLITQVENEVPEALEEMKILYPHAGRAHIIGITGSPGAGKSSLTDTLIHVFRQRGMTVGVIAVDPTSAFTGGAILGDRVRMQKHATDKGVFIRSLATRGWIGGLARATMGAIHIMDTMGKDVILVETVGSGQIEIDITRTADTTVLVLNPGAGDEIQMMKAGIIEAADIFVINKADREGAENIKMDLEVMLGMRKYILGGWEPGIFMTVAVNGKGIKELVDEIIRHREYLGQSGELRRRQKARAKLELLETMEAYLKDFVHGIDEGDYLDGLVDKLLQGKTNPHTAALEVAGRFAADLRKLQGDKPKADN
ncbi:methylmalonyl Co-A mutase-associated GTPase MeaB, partial [Chloroflexota bacterium]